MEGPGGGPRSKRQKRLRHPKHTGKRRRMDPKRGTRKGKRTRRKARRMKGTYPLRM